MKRMYRFLCDNGFVNVNDERRQPEQIKAHRKLNNANHSKNK